MRLLTIMTGFLYKLNKLYMGRIGYKGETI